MKLLIIITIFFANNIFASENIINSGKIDMHGGKSESLINKNNSLSNSDIKNIGIIKPTLPKAPEILIKNDKDKKRIKK